MTTIKFRRTGGTMGREIEAEFDLNEMPGDMAQQLQNRITESKFFSTPTQPQAAMSRPDEFEYTVTVEAGQSMHTIQVTDTSMPESLQPLIEDLNDLARSAEQGEEDLEENKSEHDYGM